MQSIEQGRLLPVQPFLYAGFSDPTQSSLSGSVLSLKSQSPAPRLSAKPASRHAVHDAIVVDSDDSQGDGGDSGPDLAELDDHDEHAAEDESMPEPNAQVAGKTTSVAAPGKTNSTRDGPAKFVRHFFAKSRLHHIGSWRTTFQQKAAEFQSVYKGERIRREPPTSSNRVILHIDMDCFFVAVAVRERPDLDGKAIAVAHSGNAGSSEVSSCNYLARDKGVRAGMFMQSAKQLCPELVVLPYNFSAIEKVSLQIYNIFFTHTPHVQAISCDEAFLEFSSSTNGFEKAKELREHIFSETRCAASVGVSFNLLLAKLASKKAKPDNIFKITTPDDAKAFMLSLKIRDLPGVGRHMGYKLEELGVESIQQLLPLSKTELQRHFGKSSSEMLYNYARGSDYRPLSTEANAMRKSVSTVVNFGIRFDTWPEVIEFMTALSEELGSRLRSLRLRTKCITILVKKRQEGQPIEPIKYMGHGICDNYSKSHIVANATDDPGIIGATCTEMLRQLRLPITDLRGMGIQASKLVSTAAVQTGSVSGMLIQKWLAEVPATETKTKGNDDEETKGSSPRENRVSGFYDVSLSQIDTDVLNELPPTVRDEVLKMYQRPATNTSALAQLRPPTAAKPKVESKAAMKALRKRTLFQSSSSAAVCSPVGNGPANTLNDIPMSQIDSEVYHALPFMIRKEIDRYAKKRKANASVPRPLSPIVDNAPENNKPPPEPLPSIEALFAHMMQITGDSHKESSGSDAFLATADVERSVGPAFDAIYSRILVEVENRALDSALKMLRYLRRKCCSSTTATPSLGCLAIRFNDVLEQVNSDVCLHFGAPLSTNSVAPL